MKKVILLIVIVLFMLCGFNYVMTKQEVASFNAVGQFVQQQDYKMHYYTKGQGERTFVLISGSGTPCSYTDYYYLQDTLSAYGKTVCYDRAGMGFSEETCAERTLDNLINELSVLIDINTDGKVVLVAHSLGGLEAIGYAQKCPERVEGIVFLDSGSPEFYSQDSEDNAKLLNTMAVVLRISGLSRINNAVRLLYGENIRNLQLDDEVKQLDLEMYYYHMGSQSTREYVSYMNENAQQIVDQGKLADIPILVLSSSQDKQWDESQQQLAEWSNISSQYTLEHAKHYIHWSNTREVENYIIHFVNEKQYSALY